jgi:excisionase family DNA binding protein
MAEREWITLGEAAAMLDVHPGTLSRWALRGRVPHKLTIGGRRRFPRAVIAALVAEGNAPLAVATPSEKVEVA